jgi:AcrR family transcriptional regulator
MAGKRRKAARPKGVRSGTSEGTSFDLLWNPLAADTAGPRRGPRATLSLESIVDAGIRLADAKGLGAVTMAGLAARLGAAPMSLYRHVPGKRALVEVMSDRALAAPPALGGGEWREAVECWSHALLERMVARPWLIEAVSYRTTVGPNWMSWLDSALAALTRSGLPQHHLVEAVLLVEGHVRSTAQLLTGAPATTEWAVSFSRTLEAVRDDTRYANVSRLAARGTLAPSGDGPISPRFGLHRILDGLEAFVGSPRRTRR